MKPQHIDESTTGAEYANADRWHWCTSIARLEDAQCDDESHHLIDEEDENHYHNWVHFLD
jgi:hypothetical protein